MAQVFNVFPTTIVVDVMQGHDKYVDDFEKVYSKYDYESKINKNGYVYNTTTSENSGNALLHLDNDLTDMFGEIALNVKKYIYEVLDYKRIFDVIITKSWLSRSRHSEDELVWHSHFTSQISFVYYLKTPPNSHLLKFFTPANTNSVFEGNNTSEFKHGIENFNLVNSSTFFIEPVAGSIVMFPSSVRHCTHSIDDNFEGERLAIVGDVTLAYKEGITDYSQGYIHPKYWKVYP